jgi:ubiquinone/menaquinone biosynthesis C-methylase UbiE
MSHVNYARWADYILSIAEKNGKKTGAVLDVSCGTGSFCLRLAKKDIRIIGSDFSRFMLRKAVEKKSANTKYPFYVLADMKHLPFKSQYDMVVSLYDSLNYLLDKSDWKLAFQQIYLLLCDGGLFIFDVSTFYNSMYVFKNYVQKESNEEAYYYRKSSFHKGTMIQKTLFEITFKTNPKMVYRETHRQRIRMLDEIEGLVQDSAFQMIARYRDFTFEPGTEASERVHFVLQKQG